MPIYKKGVKGNYYLVAGKEAWQTLKGNLRWAHNPKVAGSSPVPATSITH